MVLAVTNQKKVQAVITADTRAICAQSDAADAKDMSVLSNATTMTEGTQEITEEGRVTAAAANKDEDPASEKSETEGEDEEILAFITDRKTLKKEEKDRVGEVSKKCIRDKKRSKRQKKITKILEEMKGTKNIANIKTAKRRILIPKVKNSSGEIVTSRKGIANVFGEFKKKLNDDKEEKALKAMEGAGKNMCSELKNRRS